MTGQPRQPGQPRRLLILGAGGRDFHVFAMCYRDDPSVRVVAFTATQIPGIDDRTFPATLAGAAYPAGIPIRPEATLEALIARERVDEAVIAYSDLAHVDVMHLASRVLAAGADVTLLAPERTMLTSSRPVVAVCGARTGCGKSQTSRRVAQLLRDAGRRVVLVRHPMPYGDLDAMRVQRFATLADIDAALPTIEEREEYEEPVRAGIVTYAGVDYEAILRRAEAEADVVLWDGGNNDTPFFRPDLWITVADALRPGHELAYHPGELNLRLADAVVINKVVINTRDAATAEAVATIIANVERVNPDAVVIRAASPATLDDGPSLVGRRVLVVEDGPSLTHGGMSFGAGTVAARHAGATDLVDPRPFAVGEIAATFARYGHLGPVLPAMGYSEHQRRDLAATIAAAAPEVIVTGTPIDLRHVVEVDAPVRRAHYELQELGRPNLADVLAAHGLL